MGLGRGAGSSHGFMLNLTALMVALSAPYATTPAPPGGPSLEVALLASPAFANSTRVIMSEVLQLTHRMISVSCLGISWQAFMALNLGMFDPLFKSR